MVMIGKVNFCVIVVMLAITSCSCVCSYWGTTDELKERIPTYPFIASGKVLNIDNKKVGTVTTFELIKLYKGKTRRKILFIHQDGSNCNLRFTLNQKYLVYCYSNHNRFFTDQCTPTKFLDQADVDFEILVKSNL